MDYSKICNNISSFNDYKNIVLNYNKKDKGFVFEDFTKYIFLYHPMYSYLTYKIWLYDDIPIKTK